jgi:hypothetical protein
MKTFLSTLAAVAVMLSVGTANAVTVSDPTDWASGWTFSSVTTQGAGTASITFVATGGNPGARVNVTTVTPSVTDSAYGTAIYNSVQVPAPTSGTAFQMKIEALSGAGAFGQGQGVVALVEQGGSIYQAAFGITGFPLNSFTPLSFNGVFVAGNFTKLTGPGPATPTFDGSTPTRFGFAAGNGNSGTLTQYYDNWSIEYGTASASTPVPMFPPWGLVLLTALVALAGMKMARRYRH